MLLVAASLLSSLLWSSVLSQDLTCPTGATAPAQFYLIGASGGDSKAECENTAAATTAGLTAGMNAVELDVSVSRDNVVFLWNDPNPLDPIANARTQGLFVTGKCRPSFSSIAGSRDMVFSLIRQNYKYVDSTGEVVSDATIPTLYEWMDMFAANTALKLIILDLKIVDIDLADYLVGHIMTKAVSLGVDTKVQLVSSDYSMAAALQTSLSRAGYPINRVSRVWGGTAGAVHIGSNENFDAVTQAKDECYNMANMGMTVSSNGWRQYQTIVDNMIKKRDEIVTDGGNYLPVIGWRINNIEKITWMLCSGVDGFYTDNIGAVSTLIQRQAQGVIQCCMEDKKTPCLPAYDPRLLGQGCSTMGATYYDYNSTSCPLFDLDLFNSGTQLTCRQLKFCSVTI